MWLSLNITYVCSIDMTWITGFCCVFVKCTRCMLHFSAYITASNQISDISINSWPVNCRFGPGPNLDTPKWPLWRHFKYSACNDFGITIRVPFMMIPSTILRLSLCIQNTYNSWSKSAHCASHPF